MATFKKDDFVVLENNEGIGKVVRILAQPTQTPHEYITVYDIATYRTKSGWPCVKKDVSKEQIPGRATKEQIQWWVDCNSEWGNFRTPDNV